MKVSSNCNALLFEVTSPALVIPNYKRLDTPPVESLLASLLSTQSVYTTYHWRLKRQILFVNGMHSILGVCQVTRRVGSIL